MKTKGRFTSEAKDSFTLEATGSFTLEAAMVIPMVIFALVALIYAGFFIHDRCVLSAKALISGIQGAEQALYYIAPQTGHIQYEAALEGKPLEDVTQIQNLAMEAMSEGFLMTSPQSVSITLNSGLLYRLTGTGRVEAQTCGQAKEPDGWVYRMLGDSFGAVKATWQVRLLHQPTQIRGYDSLKSLGGVQ